MINISTIDLDKFEKKKNCQRIEHSQKNTCYSWCDCLIVYILEPIKKTVDNVKDQIMSLFKTSPTTGYSKPKHTKTVYGGGKKSSKLKIQKESEDNIIKT